VTRIILQRIGRRHASGIRAAATILCLVLIHSVPTGAKTRNDFDPGAPFSTFKTFAFVAGIDLGKTGLMDDPDTRARIGNFVSGILETRGLQEVPRDQKYDVAVRVWIALRDRQNVSTISYGNYWGGYDPFWYGPWGYEYEETVIHDYKEGTLIIDLLNPVNKQLVWRTYLKRDFKDRAKAYDQAKSELNAAFAKYPPSPKEVENKSRERAKETSR
jgi:Domain of unknown function (DUF4136)